MKVAVVGATGLVGRKMIELLEERNFPVTELIPAASERSVGMEVRFKNKVFKVKSLHDAVNEKPVFAIFSAGGAVSLEWAPKFAEVGTFVIDNSSAWRMHENIKLVVPEINAHLLTNKDKIIANPNCSTIQMVMALAPLHRLFNIKRIIVSTYQSVAGSGMKGVNQYENEKNGITSEKLYHHQIFGNCLPQIDSFLDNGYTKEEIKMVNETRKILGNNEIQITVTCVRVAVLYGHSESVYVEFEKEFDFNEIIPILSKTQGVVVQDDIKQNIYPMPINCKNKDEVFVGRIRQDLFNRKALNMWIVSDSVRKGAATNAIQIAEYIKNNLFDN